MSIRYFLCAPGILQIGAAPCDLEIRVWRPSRDGPPPAGPHCTINRLWWLFDRLRVFARRDFAELTLWRDDQWVARAIITPRWPRFGFMAPTDLQIGAVEVAPGWQRRGIALWLVRTALDRSDRGARMWYVTTGDNAASINLAIRAGFVVAGIGRIAWGRYLPPRTVT